MALRITILAILVAVCSAQSATVFQYAGEDCQGSPNTFPLDVSNPCNPGLAPNSYVRQDGVQISSHNSPNCDDEPTGRALDGRCVNIEGNSFRFYLPNTGSLGLENLRGDQIPQQDWAVSVKYRSDQAVCDPSTAFDIIVRKPGGCNTSPRVAQNSQGTWSVGLCEMSGGQPIWTGTEYSDKQCTTPLGPPLSPFTKPTGQCFSNGKPLQAEMDFCAGRNLPDVFNPFSDSADRPRGVLLGLHNSADCSDDTFFMFLFTKFGQCVPGESGTDSAMYDWNEETGNFQRRVFSGLNCQGTPNLEIDTPTVPSLCLDSGGGFFFSLDRVDGYAGPPMAPELPQPSDTWTITAQYQNSVCDTKPHTVIQAPPSLCKVLSTDQSGNFQCDGATLKGDIFAGNAECSGASSPVQFPTPLPCSPVLDQHERTFCGPTLDPIINPANYGVQLALHTADTCGGDSFAFYAFRDLDVCVNAFGGSNIFSLSDDDQELIIQVFTQENCQGQPQVLPNLPRETCVPFFEGTGLFAQGVTYQRPVCDCSKSVQLDANGVATADSTNLPACCGGKKVCLAF